MEICITVEFENIGVGIEKLGDTSEELINDLYLNLKGKFNITDGEFDFIKAKDHDDSEENKCYYEGYLYKGKYLGIILVFEFDILEGYELNLVKAALKQFLDSKGRVVVSFEKDSYIELESFRDEDFVMAARKIGIKDQEIKDEIVLEKFFNFIRRDIRMA